MRIRLVITGRSYHMAEHLPDEIELPAAATLDDALAAIAQRLADGPPLPSSCLVAVSGEHLGTIAHHRSQQLRDGDELVLIAPVAGG